MEQLEQYWQFGAALVFVLALIGILFWVLQKAGIGGGRGRRGNRLGIVEAAVVDKRRRLVLVRRDSVEHLVMIGGPQDVVVETNITRREPNLMTGTGEPARGVVPELASRGAERAAAPEPKLSGKGPKIEPAEAAPPPEQAPEKPLPHPEQPARRAEPPAEEPVRRPQPPAAAADDAVLKMEPGLVPEEAVHRPEPRDLATEAPARRPEPRARGPEGPVRRMEPHVVRPNDPPQRGDEHRPHPADMAVRPPHESVRQAPQGRPWPPSEGRFREAQRRFAERSDFPPPGRGDIREPAEEPEPVRPPERHAASRAASNGMPPERSRDVSQDGPPREPANLNVLPGEDR